MALVAAQNLSKSFGETQALSDVSIAFEAGEVHGLLGENGAGKSTFVKILSGVLAPDRGAVEVDGNPVRLGGGSRSLASISTAFQELSLLPNLTVAQNLLLPRLPRGPLGTVSRRELHHRAGEILDRWELEVPLDAEVESLDLATKQRLEIVKALSRDPKLLILDEPTAALADTSWLFQHIRDVTSRGAAVLYISHRLAEIRELCHRGSVLRNGAVVGQFARGDFDEDSVIAQMIGRSFDATFPPRSQGASEETALRVQGLSVADSPVTDVDLHVRRGEVVGVAALEGQGQRDLFYALYGLRRVVGGTVEVDGEPVSVRSPRGALHAGSGIALVPEERKVEALFLELSSQKNLTVPIISEIAVGPFILGSRERRRAREEAKRLNIAGDALERPVGRLSGGNQQKVVLAKTLLTGAKILLLFDPTRGIDAATKLEIYDLVRRLAEDGTSVLVYSTEIPELVGLCDRVYALYEGGITGEFSGESLSEDNLLGAAIGHRRHGESGSAAGPAADPGHPERAVASAESDRTQESTT
ncbi:MAG TPA: sugar ABC transporter ATP-binding protein [Baekduia sp.]|nr:sugar ABC transporter ATP-binding protein [Baekduia sp.]